MNDAENRLACDLAACVRGCDGALAKALLAALEGYLTPLAGPREGGTDLTSAPDGKPGHVRGDAGNSPTRTAEAGERAPDKGAHASTEVGGCERDSRRDGTFTTATSGEDGPWYAGAVGRTPDDDALVWRDDAVSGSQFYAASPKQAEVAAVILNGVASRLAAAEAKAREAEAELAAAVELHERAGAMVDEAIGRDRRDHPGWRYERIASNIRAIRDERDTLRAENERLKAEVHVLEGPALEIAERERNEARAEVDRLKATVDQLHGRLIMVEVARDAAIARADREHVRVNEWKEAAFGLQKRAEEAEAAVIGAATAAGEYQGRLEKAERELAEASEAIKAANVRAEFHDATHVVFDEVDTDVYTSPISDAVDARARRVVDRLKSAEAKHSASEQREARLREALAMDTPYPVPSVLRILAAFGLHALNDHDCDAHGWEVRAHATNVAGQLADAIDAALSASAPPQGETKPERFVCPDCGYGVAADEDGCCATCGRDCAIIRVISEPEDMSCTMLESRDEPPQGEVPLIVCARTYWCPRTSQDRVCGLSEGHAGPHRYRDVGVVTDEPQSEAREGQR